MSDVARKLVNGTLFNLCWFAVVMLHHDLWSWVATFAYLVLHVAVFRPARAEVQLIALVTAGGFLLDQIMFASGVLLTASGAPPLWLSALWPAFASTLSHAFAGLREHLWLAAVIGGVGGYGSYRLGASLSDVSLAAPALSATVLIAAWAILFPLLLLLAQHLVQRLAGESDHARGTC
ncbi:hypothetical protein A3709_17295 [Halioglobus sp. HI00S01]|nr:hypothetical protein A3709_17295 [Halioglobus sp. HI00S01]